MTLSPQAWRKACGRRLGPRWNLQWLIAMVLVGNLWLVLMVNHVLVCFSDGLLLVTHVLVMVGDR